LHNPHGPAGDFDAASGGFRAAGVPFGITLWAAVWQRIFLGRPEAGPEIVQNYAELCRIVHRARGSFSVQTKPNNPLFCWSS
jgi:hypothetical protein